MEQKHTKDYTNSTSIILFFLIDITSISDAHIKNTKYYWQQMTTAFINIYKCTYV